MRRFVAASLAVGLALAALAGFAPVAALAQATPPAAAANEALADRFYTDILGRADPTAFATLLTPDFVIHLEAQELDGPAAFQAFVAGLRAGFPDLTYTVEDRFAEGDKVATRATARGTQTGVFNGIPPTGNAVVVEDLILFRIAGDRIAEVWVNGDIFGLLQQLGVVPSAPAAATPASAATAMGGAAPAGTPDVAANKAQARRWFEDFANTGDLAVADELFAPDHVHHEADNPGRGSGPEGQKQLIAAARAAFPDLTYAVEDLVGAGDRVLARYVFTGTQQGPYNGIPATGKSVTVTGMAIFRFEGGKIAETWVIYDVLGLLQQLGVIPTPGATPEASPEARLAA
jgi:steroid delta-isomerase-like uncharacterized protein